MDPIERLTEELRQRKNDAAMTFSDTGGASTNKTMMATGKNGERYAVKFLRYHPGLVLRSRMRVFLDQVDPGHQKLIEYYRSAWLPEAWVYISEWVEGHSADLKILNENHEKLYQYAGAAARTLRGFHNAPVYGKEAEVHNIEKDLEDAVKFIEDKKIVFPHMGEILGILRDHMSETIVSPAGNIHLDVRPDNFVFHHGQCRLIDMETVSVGNIWRDFCYAVELNFPEERLFWKFFLDEYFQGKIPDEFWRETRTFVLITLLILMKSNWENGTLERQWELAEKIYEDYEGFTRIIPKWTDQSE